MLDYRNKNWLEKKYITEMLSATKISNSCGVCRQTILNWLKRFNIKIRGPKDAKIVSCGLYTKNKNRKICSNCKQEFPETPEYFHKQDKRNSLRSFCKKCEGKRCRNNNLKRKFNITITDYNKILREQNGRCAICGIHQSELKRGLAVDHDHKTGKIRELLCGKCNRTLGLFLDNKLIFAKMINYLSK